MQKNNTLKETSVVYYFLIWLKSIKKKQSNVKEISAVNR